MAVFAHDLCHRGSRGNRAAHGIGRGERYDELFFARFDPQRTLTDVLCFESQRRGEGVARYIQFARGGAQGAQGPAIAAGAHRYEARLHLQHQRILAQFQGAANVRGAERWMTGESHFIRGRENSHARVGAGGRQNKGGFRKVELARQRLHLFGA